jgi:hypothetical protein
MTGHRIRLPKGTKIKDGKVLNERRPRNVSEAIAMKKSKKQRPVAAGRVEIENSKRSR